VAPNEHLAWARLARLGEIALRPKIKSFAWTRTRAEHTRFFFENSLGRVTLAWARQRVAQNKSPPPRRAARTEPGRVSTILA